MFDWSPQGNFSEGFCGYLQLMNYSCLYCAYETFVSLGSDEIKVIKYWFLLQEKKLFKPMN